MGTQDFTFGLHHYVMSDAIVLEFHGELDTWADQQLGARVTALLNRPKPRVIVDLRTVTFLDAGGLRLLVRVRKRVAARRGTLWLVRGTPKVWRVLTLTRLDSSFDVLDDVPTAPGTSDGTRACCSGSMSGPDPGTPTCTWATAAPGWRI